MVGVLSLQNRSIFMGDGGDNVIHLMAIYLVFTRCGQVWSLDARRARRAREARARGEWLRPGPGRTRPVGRARLRAARWCRSRGSSTAAGWLVFFWGLWAVQGLWWAVGRHAAQR